MLRAWPVDDQIFEPKANLRPVGVQTIRERPGGEKPYGQGNDRSPSPSQMTGRSMAWEINWRIGNDRLVLGPLN